MKIPFLLIGCLMATSLAAGAGPQIFFGPRYQASPRFQSSGSPRHGPRKGLDSVRRWNQIALDATALDHTPGVPGSYGEQLGPGRSSRALAIVHIAVFDVVNALAGQYQSYTGVEAPKGPISMPAAISQAAHDALAALFPSQAATFNGYLEEDLAAVKNKKAKASGIELGQRAAAAILALRANDGSQHSEPLLGSEYQTSNLPGHWRPDPVSQLPVVLGAYWGEVVPFVLESGLAFRLPPPPALTSAEYAAAFNEVKRLGGDGVVTPTERTLEQTYIGIYWAYDGTPGLGAPPRLYNQIALRIADQMGSDAMELARLLALVNVAIADASIAVWETKFYYDFWRPVTAIREADPGTGPTGSGDGNAATLGDPTFTPLGAPASHLTGPNFTPPFPAYSSGHAGLGGALFQILRRFYGRDNISFTFVSDELNGETLDNQGNVRPLVLRSFSSLSQAEEENAQSRIYLGIHWQFDKTAGIAQGRQVADYVFTHAFVPLRRTGR